MEPVKRDSPKRKQDSAAPTEQTVKVPIASEQQRDRAAGDPEQKWVGASGNGEEDKCPGSDSAHAVFPSQVQIARHAFPAEKQSRPRNRAIENIRMNYLSHGPLLSVSCLDLAAKQQPMTGGAQSQPKLDVFDAGPSVGLVEPIRSLECFAPNRATTGPETRCFATADLVNVMMKKIPILRHQSPIRRGIVVRSKDGGQIFPSDELVFHQAQHVGMNGYIAVDKHNDVAGGRSHSTIPRSRGPVRPRVKLDQLAIPASSDRRRIVDRAVIDDHNLVRRTRRSSQRFQTLRKMVGAIMDWNDDTQSGRERLHGKATGHNRRTGKRQPIGTQ